MPPGTLIPGSGAVSPHVDVGEAAGAAELELAVIAVGETVGDGVKEGVEGVGAMEGDAVGLLMTVGFGVGVFDVHAEAARSATAPPTKNRRLRECEMSNLGSGCAEYYGQQHVVART